MLRAVLMCAAAVVLAIEILNSNESFHFSHAASDAKISNRFNIPKSTILLHLHSICVCAHISSFKSLKFSAQFKRKDNNSNQSERKDLHSVWIGFTIRASKSEWWFDSLVRVYD